MFKHTLSLVACATLVASLGADTLTLEPIVVSAIKTEQTLKNTTANVQIITAQELEEKHITSVIDALRTLGSVPVAQSGGLGQQSSFFQRGFTSANTVVMIDGIRYNDPTTTQGQAQLEHLMINNIDRIEIINGAQSGIWGANAVAGVINVITKRPTEKLEMTANVEYGSYATSKIGAAASQKINHLSYYVGVNQIKSDAFSAATPTGKNPDDYESDGYKNQTLNTKLFYDLTTNDTLGAQFNFIDAKTQYDPYATPNGDGRATSQINRLGNVSYHHQLNHEDSIDASYAITAFSKTDPVGTTKIFNGNNKEFNAQIKHHYTTDGFIVTGVNSLESTDIIRAKKLHSKGVFLTNTNRLDHLLLTESIRYDTYDLFNNKATGKAGAKYFFSTDTLLSANYGTAYRVPSLYELYATTYGNPNLLPETTKSFDATLQYKHLSATYYHNVIDNLIGYNPTTYVNEQALGKSHIKGYEIRYNNAIADNLEMGLSYNKLFAKNQEGKRLQRRPIENALASLTYCPTDKLSVGTTANYIGTRYDDLDQTLQTGRYVLWGAVVNYDMSKTLTLYVKGENLSNRLYQEVDGYGTAGRSVYAGLNARF